MTAGQDIERFTDSEQGGMRNSYISTQRTATIRPFVPPFPGGWVGGCMGGRRASKCLSVCVCVFQGLHGFACSGFVVEFLKKVGFLGLPGGLSQNPETTSRHEAAGQSTASAGAMFLHAPGRVMGPRMLRPEEALNPNHEYRRHLHFLGSNFLSPAAISPKQGDKL